MPLHPPGSPLGSGRSDGRQSSPLAGDDKGGDKPTEVLIADGRFELKRKLGSGSFGDVYQGYDRNMQRDVAVKLEHQKARYPQLRNEVKILKLIGAMKKRSAGYTRVFWDGVEGEFSVMVMEYLGPSLEVLFDYCKRKFSLKTTLMLGEQMIRRLEALHNVLFLHRDIKPDNFVLGRGSYGHHVYLIDFGLSKRYWNAKTDQHVEYQDGRPLVGTARYTSLATHLGIEPSRRDDLEALGYVLLYFVKGTLPWMGIQATGRDKIIKIGEKKESMSIDALCRGEHPCWRRYMCYVRTMKYEEQPDYSALRRMLRRAMEEERHECDWVYDWVAYRRKRLRLQKRRAKRKEQLEAGGFTGEPADSELESNFSTTDDSSQASSGQKQIAKVKSAAMGRIARPAESIEDDARAGSFLHAAIN
eukprot:TRINITY_DN1234_c1_g1_i1.p2 TRINITY_DN1234_c1_g1~~TRINITY_DN1234_c1_g1_i1.p2  ORF type:complete len:416 (+),score=141.24 TRINITY_DN1234_c1_g1_i1:161-1408(+)